MHRFPYLWVSFYFKLDHLSSFPAPHLYSWRLKVLTSQFILCLKGHTVFFSFFKLSSDWLPLAKKKKSSVLEVIIFRGAHKWSAGAHALLFWQRMCTYGPLMCTPDHITSSLVFCGAVWLFAHVWNFGHVLYVIQRSQVDMTENKEKRNKSNSCL